MRAARLERLVAQAAAVGARVNRAGDGGFLILYQGERHLVVSLRAVEVVLRQFEGGAAPQDQCRLGHSRGQPCVDAL
jgi:hypothetical protein